MLDHDDRIAFVNEPIEDRQQALHVVDMRVQEGSPAAGRALRDLQFPPEVLVSVVIGRDGATVPAGDTVLNVGDEVIAVIPREADAAVRSMIAGPKAEVV